MATLRVRLLSDRAGLSSAGGMFHQEEGQVIECERANALAMIASGAAELIEDEIETANLETPKRRRGRPRKINEGTS